VPPDGIAFRVTDVPLAIVGFWGDMEADNAELTVTVADADTEAGSESDTVTAGYSVKVVVVDGEMVH
jgi:hypothetical protein